MNLPKRLAYARKKAGLSQAALAAKLHVSAGTVGSWETGDHGIRWERLEKVARALGVSVAELVA